MSLPRASFVAVFLLLAGPALAQDGDVVDRVQMGDNDLDCVQIATQVKDIDTQLAPHSGDQGAVRGATESVTRSRTGEVVAGVAKVFPFGSIFGDLAKDVLGRRGREADARLASLRARKEYLVDMFLKRGCRVAGSSPAGDGKSGAVAGAATPIAGAVTAPPAQIPTSVQAAVPPATPPGIPVPAVEPLPSATAIVAAQPPAATPPAPVEPRAADVPAPVVAPRGPLFVLDFRLAFRTSADADGVAGAPGLELGGVPVTTMQAITDAAYVALLKDLAQAGFEVLNPQLKSAPPGTSGPPTPARAGDYLYFAPSGAPPAQAPVAQQPGSDAALAETRAALAQAVAGRNPGVSYGIGVWYVDFARVRSAAGNDQQRQLESRLAVAAGSHLALVEPAAGGTTPADAVRVLNLGRDLVSREPYGQVRLTGGGSALELMADPKRFTALVERQLRRGRSALIASLPAPAVVPATAAPGEAALVPMPEASAPPMPLAPH